MLKRAWNEEEDELMVKLIVEKGTKHWSSIASELNTSRTGKQCRERWHNQLDPHICKIMWTYEEDLVLVQAHQDLGNKWADIAKLLPGRTDNSVKNHWNSAKRRLTRQPPPNPDPLLPQETDPSGAPVAHPTSLKKLKINPKQKLSRLVSPRPLSEITVGDINEKSGKNDTDESEYDNNDTKKLSNLKSTQKSAQKVAMKRKVKGMQSLHQECPFDRWGISPRKRAAVSKVNKFLSNIPWRSEEDSVETGRGFITPPIDLDSKNIDLKNDDSNHGSVQGSNPPYRLPEDHEVADVLLKLLSPATVSSGSATGNETDNENNNSIIYNENSNRIIYNENSNSMIDNENNENNNNMMYYSSINENSNSIEYGSIVGTPFDGENRQSFQGLQPFKKRFNQSKSTDGPRTISPPAGPFSHFRSLSALADLASTELSSPNGTKGSKVSKGTVCKVTGSRGTGLEIPNVLPCLLSRPQPITMNPSSSSYTKGSQALEGLKGSLKISAEKVSFKSRVNEDLISFREDCTPSPPLSTTSMSSAETSEEDWSLIGLTSRSDSRPDSRSSESCKSQNKFCLSSSLSSSFSSSSSLSSSFSSSMSSSISLPSISSSSSSSSYLSSALSSSLSKTTDRSVEPSCVSITECVRPFKFVKKT